MSAVCRGQHSQNLSLRSYNTWRVGGRARQAYCPADIDDLAIFLAQLPEDEPLVWLGLGSNVLIADAGLDATVILTQGGLETLTDLEEGCFYAGAGITCAKAAKFCVRHDLLQGEFFAGIPGTIGGALAMNAGAFGGETWTYVRAVDVINHAGVVRRRDKSEYTIAYRSVTGPGITEGEREWFIGAEFCLPRGDGQVTAVKIKELLKKRGETQPIGLPSCGSVFVNPLGDHAARLIENCGLKGHRIGGAEVSVKHANFIINAEDATAADILNLIHWVQKTVLAKTGVALHTEVRLLGFDTLGQENA